MTKKTEAKTEENKPKQEAKPTKSELKDTREITLSTFKDIHSVDEMEYVGLKALLKAEDGDKFTETKLKTDLEKLRKKNAFR